MDKPAPSALEVAVLSALSPHFFRSTHRALDGGACLVSFEGDLDLAVAPQVKWALVELLGAGHTRFVVDLSRVEFVDSTALGVLVGFERTLPEGGRLVIAAASPAVLKLFEVTGLDQRFELAPAVEEAETRLKRA